MKSIAKCSEYPANEGKIRARERQYTKRYKKDVVNVQPMKARYEEFVSNVQPLKTKI